MKRTVSIALAAALGTLTAQAYIGLATTNLKTLAVTDDTGALVVLSSAEGSYGNVPGNTKAALFDGVRDGQFCFDPESSGPHWGGYELTTPMTVTRVRFWGRGGNSDINTRRAVGSRFQGANSADFTDAVTLYTVPDSYTAAELRAGQDGFVTDLALLGQTFTYLRVIGDCGGNFQEVEFYGVSADTLAAAAAPAAGPAWAETPFDLINGRLNYGFTAQADACLHRLDYRYTGEEAWTTLAEHWFLDEGTAVRSAAATYFVRDAEVRLVAVNLAGETAGDAKTVPFRTRLAGTIIGTNGSYNDGVNTKEKAFDGDMSTYYDGKTETDWMGLDLGEARRVGGVRIVARDGQEHRTKSIPVEISDTANFAEKTVLARLPDENGDSTRAVEYSTANDSFTAGTARYVRICPVWGNLAEVEFLPADATPNVAPRNVTVAPDDDGAPVFSWERPDVPCNTIRVTRSAAAGGGTGDVVMSVDLRGDATGWTDETAVSGVTYFYTFQSVNTVDGTDYPGACVEMTYVPAKRLALTTAKPIWYYVAPSNWSGDGRRIVDGDTQTAPDVGNKKYEDTSDDTVKVGVDLGSAYSIGRFAFYPRPGWEGRANGVILYGSNDASDIAGFSWCADPTAISAASAVSARQWYTFETTSREAYRFIYFSRPEGDFFGNIAELKLYGWTADDVAAVLTEPKDAAAAWKGSRVRLSWEPVAAAASYRVERRVEDGEWTTVSEDGLTDCALTDEPPHPARETYFYRVAAVGANGDLAFTLPFAPGGEPAPHGFRVIVK